MTMEAHYLFYDSITYRPSAVGGFVADTRKRKIPQSMLTDEMERGARLRLIENRERRVDEERLAQANGAYAALACVARSFGGRVSIVADYELGTAKILLSGVARFILAEESWGWFGPALERAAFCTFQSDRRRGLSLELYYDLFL